MRLAWFDTPAFYEAVDSVRRTRRLPWSQVARESGLTPSTLTRMAQGKRPDIDGLAALCVWSSLAADDYIRERTNGTEVVPAGGNRDFSA
jgi:transcriptional regulator with XRE-family HTH domain